MSTEIRSNLIDILLVLLTSLLIWNTYDALYHRSATFPETSIGAADQELKIFLENKAFLSDHLQNLVDAVAPIPFPDREDFEWTLAELKVALDLSGLAALEFPEKNESTIIDGTLSWSTESEIAFEKDEQQ